MVQTSDVIVIGLGGVGSAACYHLTQRGLRVTGLEQFEAVHHRGASHGETRGVWQAYFMGPAYVRLLARAYELWDRLAVECGETFLHRTGGICIGPEDGQLVPAARQSANSCGLVHEYLSAETIRERFPNLAPSKGEVGIYDPSCGYVRPERVVRTHIDGALSRGADLRFAEPVIQCETGGSSVRVHTARGTYEAEKLVVSTGAWLNRLLPWVKIPVQVLRKVMMWFEPIQDRESFAVGAHPYWIWEADGQIGYGHPAVDGLAGGLKAGIHSAGTPTDPDQLDRLVREDDVREVREFVKDRVPKLAGEYLRGAVCMYDNTPDMGFVVGPAPEDPRILLAAGTSGHAFKFVPLLGEIVSDLVLTGRTESDISIFAPERFLPSSVRTAPAQDSQENVGLFAR